MSHSGRLELPAAHLSSTRWSLVAQVRDIDPQIKRAALAKLVERYMPALRSYLVSNKRLSLDRAEDILQGFLLDVVLEDDLISRAAQEKGKLRTLLLTALDRFIINGIRHDQAKKRSTNAMATFEEALNHADSKPAPDDAFDIAWARQVLDQAVELMQLECQTSARPDIWGVFEGRVLGPTLEGAERVPYEVLVERWGFESTTEASNVLVTGKRMFARSLRRVVGEYELTELAVEQEIAEIKAVLARRRC